MLSVDEARRKILDLVTVVAAETVPLDRACGRVLAHPVVAQRPQPPFPASAMDGYAVINADVAPGARLRVIGEAPAGHAWRGELRQGEAVRVFTGAPMPEGSDRVVIQEDTTRDGETVVLGATLDAQHYVRPAGVDFDAGFEFCPRRRLTPRDVALLAAMNSEAVSVYRQPEIAIAATGDELVPPGGAPKDDQIISSNTYGLAALFEMAGAKVRCLPIAADTQPAVESVLALAEGADLLVTTGGASVGDHDIIARTQAEPQHETTFYKVAMRPGKPLMAGRRNGIPMIGLPGNPVSTMVCATIFILPAIQQMSGLPGSPPPTEQALLSAPLPKNGPREHYMRARRNDDGSVRAVESQDSGRMALLASADALIVRAPHAPALEAGAPVDILPL